MHLPSMQAGIRGSRAGAMDPGQPRSTASGMTMEGSRQRVASEYIFSTCSQFTRFSRKALR
jgi:hypothetical protein